MNSHRLLSHRPGETRPGRAGALTALLVLTAGLLHSGTARAQDKAAPAAVGDPPITITYTGNEGFLIQVADRKVLVDSLYREGVEGYVAPSRDEVEKREGGAPPFDGVTLALATHYHADHYHPEAVGRFLSRNPQASFLSTKQAREALASHYDDFAAIAERVRGVLPAEGSTATEEFGDIKVTVLNLHHGRTRPVENLGFLVEIDGRRILHIGDTEATASDLGPLGLARLQIDVAFIPFWYLVEGGWHQAVRQQIGAARIVVMHLPAPDAGDRYIDSLGGWDTVAAGITRDFPNATVFRRVMDSTQY